MTKLKGYGIGGKLLDWIIDFLDERTQFVTVGGYSSAEAPVTSGVPQGSVLGPTLFVYYINDMPDVVDCLIKIFADDTKLYSEVSNSNQSQKLQLNTDKLQEWTETWQIVFNCSKCKVLHMGFKNEKCEYKMNDVALQQTTSEKDLGVIIDPDLSFDAHVLETVKKANRVMGNISRTIINKDRDIMVPLFKALVRSVLEYGNAVWFPYLQKKYSGY